jgi:predicted metal-dependent hydrolase
MNNWLADMISGLGRLRKVEPCEITLHYVGKTWNIIYDPSLPTQKPCESGHDLFLPVKAKNHKEVMALLKLWLRQKAWLYLPQHLSELSKEHHLPFSGLSIRTQKTRWGSCSAHKKINLNSKLLFLPKRLVDYVIIHELCHTKFLNHSVNFWNLVEHHMPHYKRLEHEIKGENNFVPSWFH